MNNYFRITAYNPENNIGFIIAFRTYGNNEASKKRSNTKNLSMGLSVLNSTKWLSHAPT